MNKLVITSALALLVGASTLVAQDQPRREGRGPRPGSPGAPGPRGGSPIMFIFDTNKDGTIDSTEIDNASAVLKKMDRNGDGNLTPDELRPQRPARPEQPAE